MVALGTACEMGGVNLDITATSIICDRSGATSRSASRFFNSRHVCRLTGRNAFALRFQIAVDGRRNGLSRPVRRVPPGRRGDGSCEGVAKTHVSWWGDLPPQGGQVSCHEAGLEGKRSAEGGHRDVVGVPDGRVRGSGRDPGSKEELKPGYSRFHF